MGKLRREAKRLEQVELLKLFAHQTEDHYEELERDNIVYIKSHNGNTGNWQVAKYSPESFRKYKEFNEANKIHHQLNDEFKAIIKE